MAYITLNKNNFFNNLDIISKQSKTKDKIAIVLKDNAYGHGIVEIAAMAQEYGLSKCVVQSYDEAQRIRSYFDYILVLSDFPKVYDSAIYYSINDIDAIKKFPKNTKVELKVDTGMHRNGISLSELEQAFQLIDAQGLSLEALFMHHRSADELTSEWFWQKDIFKKVKVEALKLAKKYGFAQLRFHSANSAALLRESNFQEDMARIGIAAYGCIDLPKAIRVEGLKPVLSLYASRISSRVLSKGSKVGYGGSYRASEDLVVSNYDIGYGSGFMRALSNLYQTPNQEVLVGRISMDNSSFISDAEELLLFDNAFDVAKYAKTISYEVLTSLKPHLKRVIV